MPPRLLVALVDVRAPVVAPVVVVGAVLLGPGEPSLDAETVLGVGIGVAPAAAQNLAMRRVLRPSITQNCQEMGFAFQKNGTKFSPWVLAYLSCGGIATYLHAFAASLALGANWAGVVSAVAVFAVVVPSAARIHPLEAGTVGEPRSVSGEREALGATGTPDTTGIVLEKSLRLRHLEGSLTKNLPLGIPGIPSSPSTVSGTPLASLWPSPGPRTFPP